MRLLRAPARHGSGRSRASQQPRCPCCVGPNTNTSNTSNSSSSSSTAAASSSMSPSVALAATRPANEQAALLARVRAALPNARDLHEAFPAIPPGRLIRCANPSAAGPEACRLLLRELRVGHLVDLRSAEEMAEDDPGSALMAAAALQQYSRAWLVPGQMVVRPGRTAQPGTPTPSASKDGSEGNGSEGSGSGSDAAAGTSAREARSTDSTSDANDAADAIEASASASASAADTSEPQPPQLVRHHISLLERSRYYVALAARIPASTTAAALVTNLWSRPAARRLLLPYVNGGGLCMLYEMLLDSARPELRAALEVLLSAAESRRGALFFCRAGKDRTGLLAAAVLAVAGADEEAIVADYARSDAHHRVALAGLERREELAGLDMAAFERAPPEAMRATLQHVRARYGSLCGYLTAIGFGPDRQARLRELLTAPEW